jgi:hypothetical protein
MPIGGSPFARGDRHLQMRGGGHFVEAGGRGTSWYARLVGYVTPKGGPRQHVVVKLKGRGTGTFVITPTKPGTLKRDSGTPRFVLPAVAKPGRR